MGKVLVTDTYLTDIGNAIRSKNGTTDTYKPSEMASAIENIEAVVAERLQAVRDGLYARALANREAKTYECTSIDEIGNWLLEGALILPVRQTFVCCVSGDSCVDCHRSLRLRQSRMGAGCSTLKPVATDEWFLTNFACGLPAHLCGQP